MEIPIDQITVLDNRRSPQNIEVLAQSIQEVGLLNPITVAKDFALIAGRSRLEACKTLGWSTITAHVLVTTDLKTELATIYENLCRTELTMLERAEQLKRRKDIYEALFPETKAGASGGLTRKGGAGLLTNDATSFVNNTSASMDRSPGTISRSVKIATDIPQNLRDAIRDTPLADQQMELEALSRIKDPEKQREVVRKIGEGTIKSIRKATHQLLTSSNSNEWYTPARYVDAARAVMGGIDLDPASCVQANEIVQAHTFYTIEDDGLEQSWYGHVWLNPPYGGLAGLFVERLIQDYELGLVEEAIVLVNAHATDTAWFQPLFDYPLCFTDHRIDFTPSGHQKTRSTNGSVFVYLGTKSHAFLEHFEVFGAVLIRMRHV
jgi:ParB family chromosome partitioning protein